MYKGGDCTSFCSRTIRQYLDRLAGCRKSLPAQETVLLTTNCKTQCGVARQEILNRTPVLAKEQKLLRDEDCDENCKAIILEQTRNRRPQALVFSALNGSSFRSGVHLFAPWVWTRKMKWRFLCGNPLQSCAMYHIPRKRPNKAAEYVIIKRRRARPRARAAGRFLL